MLKHIIRSCASVKLSRTFRQRDILQNKPYVCYNVTLPEFTSRLISTTVINYKKTKQKTQLESDSDGEKEDTYEDSIVDKNTKVFDLKVTSLRLDGILKAGLGLARNKVELNFYENKIRLNGEKVLKKSESVEVGDEIDVIKGPSPTNPKLLTVARVEILNITPKDEYIALKLRRCKSLLIENYSASWKPG